MQDKVFLDTNILLYLLSDNTPKKKIAKRLLNSNHNISTQVLNEFGNVCLNKLKINHLDVITMINELVVNTTIYNYNSNTIIQAITIKHTYQLQFYDALIIATALENNCNILYSEDMHHNQLIENKLKIINPFI
jgi:predicted nucleic acid-binding protein